MKKQRAFFLSRKNTKGFLFNTNGFSQRKKLRFFFFEKKVLFLNKGVLFFEHKRVLFLDTNGWFFSRTKGLSFFTHKGFFSRTKGFFHAQRVFFTLSRKKKVF